jgi:hypothetical protein
MIGIRLQVHSPPPPILLRLRKSNQLIQLAVEFARGQLRPVDQLSQLGLDRGVCSGRIQPRQLGLNQSTAAQLSVGGWVGGCGWVLAGLCVPVCLVPAGLVRGAGHRSHRRS